MIYILFRLDREIEDRFSERYDVCGVFANKKKAMIAKRELLRTIKDNPDIFGCCDFYSETKTDYLNVNDNIKDFSKVYAIIKEFPDCIFESDPHWSLSPNRYISEGYSYMTEDEMKKMQVWGEMVSKRDRWGNMKV